MARRVKFRLLLLDLPLGRLILGVLGLIFGLGCAHAIPMVTPAQLVECSDAKGIQESAKLGKTVSVTPAYLNGPVPAVPKQLRGIPGKVTVSFVVGVDGHPEKCSMMAESTTDAALIPYAFGTLLGSNFRVAEKDGVKVRMLVTQTVNYYTR